MSGGVGRGRVAAASGRRVVFDVGVVGGSATQRYSTILRSGARSKPAHCCIHISVGDRKGVYTTIPVLLLPIILAVPVLELFLIVPEVPGYLAENTVWAPEPRFQHTVCPRMSTRKVQVEPKCTLGTSKVE